MEKIIDDIIDRAGGTTRLAKHLGIKHSSLYDWRRVPAGHVLVIERLTGISRHEIRPDVFGCIDGDDVSVSNTEGGARE